MIDLSIIIVNYKSEPELLDLLSSIYLGNFKETIEIIVVDNSNNNQFKDELKKEFPKVSYVRANRNIGYGAGNNLGAKLAKGKFLFFLNPDTKIFSGSPTNILRLLNLSDTGLVAPLLLDSNNKPYDLQGTKELTPKRALFSLSFLIKFFPKNKIYRQYYMLAWNKKKLKEVDVVPGTAIFVRKEVFQEIGGFDNKFFLFFEEFDLAKRIKAKGYRNFIHPDLKINHKWGVSTSKNSNIDKYFHESRLYYFKKNYGWLKGLMTESLLRIDKYTFALLAVCLFGLFLRIYQIPEKMFFIPDIAWFYLSGRDMILNGQIPLVGIPSSHPWLSQGPLWTYILGILLNIFNFNPIYPAYFTAVLDVITLIIVYKLTSEFFNRNAAIIGSLFYATSPLIITSSQTPYHTSVIPFFTVLLLYTVAKWVKGNILYFPLSIFFLAVLYNFELATFSLTIAFIFLLVIGLARKKKWAIATLNIRIVLLSLVSFLIPMMPIIIYDFTHGFPQTVKFIIWIFYRVAVFFGFPPVNPQATSETLNSFLHFGALEVEKLFIPNQRIAIFIFLTLIFFGMFKAISGKFKNYALNVLLILTLIPVLGYIAAKTNSAAYFPMFFPQAAILFGLFFASFQKKIIVVPILIVTLMTVVNTYTVLNTQPQIFFSQRINAAKEIVGKANGRNYNIYEKNEASGFKNFIQNYEYLTWYLGNGPSQSNEKLKFYVSEPSGKIIVEEKE